MYVSSKMLARRVGLVDSWVICVFFQPNLDIQFRCNFFKLIFKLSTSNVAANRVADRNKTGAVERIEIIEIH